MVIDFNIYEDTYKNDKFRESMELFPFDPSNDVKFSKECGYKGLAGAFLRLLAKEEKIQTIQDFEKSLSEPVYKYLTNEKEMQENQAKEFLDILKDVFWVDGNINVTDLTILKYCPLLPLDNDILERSKYKNKYEKGILALANYLNSFLSVEIAEFYKYNSENLLLTIIKEALEFATRNSNDENIKSKTKPKEKEINYLILPFIKNSFEEDLKWFLEQKNSFKIKYFNYFLYFYVCYSIVQSVVNLDLNNEISNEEPICFYFLLDSERASANHDAVTRGWSYHLPTSSLEGLFGKIQALDIVNTILGGKTGFYPDILKKLNETPFETNKEACIKILDSYQNRKRNTLLGRGTEKNINFGEPIDTSVNSYEEFLKKLIKLCVTLQSDTYKKMGNFVEDILDLGLRQCRRGNYVLALDNDMLLFLIALFSKNDFKCNYGNSAENKILLDLLYTRFKRYGIVFNRNTRLAIEDYLLKLNLLDRKSDSGEAQYVRVIL